MLAGFEDWYWWLAGGVAALLGSVGMCLALFRDRSRGRRRCPKCWYDMRGTPGMCCSECGFTARRERQLFQTRRAWRAAILGFLFVLIGISGVLAPQVNRDGPLSLIPVMILTRLAEPLPMYATNNSSVSRMSRTGSDWAWEEISRRQLSGPSLSTSDLEYLIRNKQFLRVRSKWPRGVPLVCWENRDVPWFINLSVSSAASQRSSSGAVNRTLPANYFRVEPRSTDSNRVDLNVWASIDAGPMTGTGGWMKPTTTDVAEFKVDFPVRMVATLDDAIRPVRDAATNDILKRGLRITIDGGPQEETHVAWITLCIALDDTAADSLRRLAMAFEIELRHDDKPVESVSIGRANMRHYDQNGRSRAGLGCRREFQTVRAEDLLAADAVDHWSVRVRGDAEAALLDFDCDEYWAGEFTLPISGVLGWTQPDDVSAIP